MFHRIQRLNEVRHSLLSWSILPLNYSIIAKRNTHKPHPAGTTDFGRTCRSTCLIPHRLTPPSQTISRCLFLVNGYLHLLIFSSPFNYVATMALRGRRRTSPRASPPEILFLINSSATSLRESSLVNCRPYAPLDRVSAIYDSPSLCKPVDPQLPQAATLSPQCSSSIPKTSLSRPQAALYRSTSTITRRGPYTSLQQTSHLSTPLGSSKGLVRRSDCGSVSYVHPVIKTDSKEERRRRGTADFDTRIAEKRKLPWRRNGDSARVR